MDLKTFLDGKDRKAFAKKAKVSFHYLNNLCQRPRQCGKNTAFKIVAASDGLLTIDDILHPPDDVNINC